MFVGMFRTTCKLYESINPFFTNQLTLSEHRKVFKVRLAIFQHYERKGYERKG